VNLGGGPFTLNQLQFFGTGAGTWDVVNGTIVFDGTNPTFVNQGGSSGIVGLLPSLQLNANTAFEIDNASAVTEVTGTISGTGQLTKTGSGALVLIGTNTYSGGTTISAGTLQIGNGDMSGSIVGNVADNGTLAFDRSDTVAFGSVVSGTGSLVQLGSGTLVLTGNNTYTGGTTISAGTLQIGNGGTTGSITGNVTDNGTFAFDRSDAATFAGAISGTGSLAQLGGGTLTLTGNNTYSGVTTISAGALQIGNGGTSGSIAGNVTDNGTLAFDRSDAVTFSGVISGTGSLLQLGSNTLTLTGNSTYTGGTTVSAGTLQIGNGGTSGSITGNVTDNGSLASDRSDAVTFAGAISGTGSLAQLGSGTLTLTGNNTYTGSTTISAGTLQVGNGGTSGSISGPVTDNGTLAFDRSDAVTFSGVISGTGSLLQLGSNTLTLTGNSTYTGGTAVSAGTLQIGNGGTSGNITGNVTDNGTLAFDRSDAVTFAGAISGTGSLAQLGSGTLTLTGNNTYTGSTTISAGTLQVGNGGTSGSISGPVTDNGTLAFDRSDAVTFSGVISGSGSLLQLGSNALTLTANNTYTGGTTISAGTLQLGNGGTSGSITGNVTDNGTLAFDRSDAVTFGGVISGTGSMVQLGSSTLTLTGNNTYSGSTTISAGTLQLGNGGTSGSITGNVSDNGVLAFDRSDSVTFAGVIAGAGGVTQIGTGTTILTGSNTYSGGTIITAGTLEAGSASALSQNSEFTVNSILDLHGFNSTIGSLSGTGAVLNNGATAAALAVGNNNASTTFSGVLQDGTSALQLTKSGTGTLILTGANTYSGGTTISAGTLQIGNGGTTGSIVGNVVDNAALVFDRSGPLAFTGLISGTGTVTQNGTGTLTLGGNNTYSGGTSITGGVLSVTVDGNLGIGGLSISNGAELLTTGPSFSSAKSIALGIGGGTLASVTGTTASYSGVISGSGQLSIGDAANAGTIVLSGLNTYSGGTALNSGTLVVNSSQALGVGNVQVIGGILTADPQPINVKGNYTQSAGGTLQLQVASANPGQYDTLNVGGNATLDGTLQLLSLGFQPRAGNQLTLVTTGGVVSGRFAQFLNPFAAGPGFNTVDLVYGRNSVLLEFLNLTSPVPSPIPAPAPPPVIVTINFASFALTPNQLAAGNLLDQIQLNPKAADLISFLAQQPVSNLPGDFEKISPEGLTAFYEITFSNANIQRLNLEGRLDDIRNGSNGFSSNMKVNGATVNLEKKDAVDGKSSKGVVEPILQPGPQNRWGVWVTGFGDFVNVDADGNANGYDFTTGGFSLGIDYRISDQLAIGAMGEYSHTWTSLQPSGDIDVDSGRGGVYATWFNHGLYLNGAIYGGHNTYESSRSSLGGLATGSTEGAEWSTFISGGYDFHFGHLSVGPIAALQYTYLNIDGFSEKSSLAPLQVHSGSAESLRSDVGFRAFYQWQIGKVLVEPSLKAAWEHEYKYSALPITAGFAGIPGPSATFFGPSEGHDSAIVSAGISAQLTPSVTTYVNYDGQLGRGRYDSNAVTGGFRITF